jgi:hypothetical protein
VSPWAPSPKPVWCHTPTLAPVLLLYAGSRSGWRYTRCNTTFNSVEWDTDFCKGILIKDPCLIKTKIIKIELTK